MMKKCKTILGILLMAMTMFSVTSCDDDWFDDDWWDEGGWNDDHRAESAMRGRWFVQYVEIKYGNCPYYEYDEFNFYSNGRMEVFGSADFYERGRWYIDNRRMYIDLDLDGRADMVGYIDEFYRDFVSFDIKDNYEGSRYYLEMRR